MEAIRTADTAEDARSAPLWQRSIVDFLLMKKLSEYVPINPLEEVSLFRGWYSGRFENNSSHAHKND